MLLEGELLDDQPGRFPCVSKAYGPFESIRLRQNNPALAKLNIENYIWYALVRFVQCLNVHFISILIIECVGDILAERMPQQ